MRVFEKTYDPHTGTWTTIGSQDDKLIVRSDQDVESSLDHTSRLRNSTEYSAEGIKKSWFHAAHIPNVVVLKMKMEDGFDATTAHPKEIVRFLNRNKEKYGYLFTTTRRV